MEPKEFEELLDDVETRLDRVRALYENWFRGYEKLEPMTARKDVERRIYTMRKELPRNTGLRFRYNTLFQRYTTLTNYWHRTGKQIEEGTYRPQLQRLKRKKEREKEQEQERAQQRARDTRATGAGRDSELPPPQSYELNLDEQLDVRDLLDDHELDAVARAVDQPGPYSEPPPTVQQPLPRPMATFAKPVDIARGSAPKPVPRAMAEASRDAEPPPVQLEPPAAAPRAPAVAAPSQAKPLPLPAALSAPRVPPPPPGASSPKPVPVPPPPANLRPSAPGVPPPRPPLPAPGSPITASGVRAAPVVPGPSSPRPVPSAPTAAKPAAAGDGLGEQRMKSLYDEYTSARRKNNEGEVRYDALVNSIQKMLPELQKRHAGKQIDFEIVMKDGRVGLKPKAR